MIQSLAELKYKKHEELILKPKPVKATKEVKPKNN